jgi:DNA-directed RNA polymerase specialized sigma24 family protein
VHRGTPDEALLGAIANGDQRAMQVLYARHHVRVYRFVLRLTQDRSLAEDIVSDVFIDMWRQEEIPARLSRSMIASLTVACGA